MLVEDEHGGVGLTAGLPDLTVRGDATGSRCTAGDLPSHMFHAGYRSAVSEPRFVPDPRVVC
ncbi:hypothetical protein GCM10012278_59040 [Nonomuraea glycinis]|uniref:Uncharacterized protein n=1 Tax=Nonomuraea glycinis TaxID=2047744 RepID=A0A918A9M5_9ACTN|nr:hypothetical protein GCM10012278_59040 [Nonomuraea glycinis]